MSVNKSNEDAAMLDQLEAFDPVLVAAPFLGCLLYGHGLLMASRSKL